MTMRERESRVQESAVSHKVLRSRLEGIDTELRYVKSKLARERAWVLALDERVEELEHVLGVVHDLAEKLCGDMPVGDIIRLPQVRVIQARVAGVLFDDDSDVRCPTCRRTHVD